MPHGVERPSRATVIASKPKEAATSPVSTFSVPATWVAPARPASPPDSSMTTMYPALTLIPAVRAAFGLAPTARRRNPIVERSISQDTNSTARIARTKPQCSRKESPSRRGNRAESGSCGEMGLVDPSRWKAGVVSR
ncbi:Uncharacterised protein [Mycobacteroides abscessus subsp. abscessus]|nr:Uncharacterised protein [Mycobacteroides abscessus subsp. abscessus]